MHVSAAIAMFVGTYRSFPCRRDDRTWWRREEEGGSVAVRRLLISYSMLPEGITWSCDAVGARDWRMEYVRCMLDVVGSVRR